MTKHDQDTSFQSASVSLVAECGPLSVELAGHLLDRGFSVNVFAGNKQAWESFELGVELFVSPPEDVRVKANKAAKTVFMSTLFTDCKSAESAVEKDGVVLGELFASPPTTRVVLVFPRKTTQVVNNLLVALVNRFKNQSKTKIVFVESLFSPELVQNTFDPLYHFVSASAKNESTAPKVIRPTLPAEAAHYIARELYSLSFDTTALSLIGKKVNTEKLQVPTAQDKTTRLPVQTFAYFTTPQKRVLPSRVSLVQITSQRQVPQPAQISTPVVAPAKSPPPSKKEQKLPKKKRRIVSAVLWLLFVLLVFETFAILIAWISTVSSLSALGKGNFAQVQTATEVSTSALVIAQKPVTILASVPKVGTSLYSLVSIFEAWGRVNGLVGTIANNGQGLSNFGSKIIGTRPHDPKEFVQQVAPVVDNVMREVKFLEAESKSNKLLGRVMGYLLPKGITNIKNNIEHAQAFLTHIPVLLGSEQPQTYLFIVQDDSYLWPSGGRISTLVFVKVEAGRIVDTSFVDVSTADTSFKGQIDPPRELVDNLGLINWKISTANWQADFTETAKQVAWFVERGMDIKLSGVVAIDTQVLAALLSVFGPVEISEASTTTTSANFADQLAGAADREAYLFALSKQLHSVVLRPVAPGLRAISLLYKLAQQKHIQSYFVESGAQSAVENLGFAGRIFKPQCQVSNCQDTSLAFAESVSETSGPAIHVARSFKHTIKLGPHQTTKELVVTFTNSGAKTYKTYFKVYAPAVAEFASATVKQDKSQYSQGTTITSAFGRTESALHIEVPPGSQKTVAFNWTEKTELDFATFGQYNLYLRKHPGTNADTLFVDLTFPEGLALRESMRGLTGASALVYNTDLLQDQVLLFSW